MLKTRPLISVVIIAVAADPLLKRAVASILNQDEPADVIVVNSKGGNATELLAEFGSCIRIIENDALLYPGGARNLGILEAHTPYVAFLASDCVATPGWISGRLTLHLGGEACVASAVLPDRPLNVYSWADQLLLFPQRLPLLLADRVILYGVSFRREIFEDYGLFDPTLISGEDSEFLSRLKPKHKPAWSPKIITLHANRSNFFSLMSDQYRRGYRFGIEMRKVFRSEPRHLIFFFMKHSLGAYSFARDGLKGRDRVLAFVSLPIVAVGCIFKALGIYSMNHLISEIDAQTKPNNSAKDSSAVVN